MTAASWVYEPRFIYFLFNKKIFFVFVNIVRPKAAERDSNQTSSFSTSSYTWSKDFPKLTIIFARRKTLTLQLHSITIYTPLTLFCCCFLIISFFILSRYGKLIKYFFIWQHHKAAKHTHDLARRLESIFFTNRSRKIFTLFMKTGLMESFLEWEMCVYLTSSDGKRDIMNP